jgi:hypothetical protein
MPIKRYSWFLAGAYVLFGSVPFLLLPKFQVLYSGFDIELPLMTRATLAVGPAGWVCASATVGVLVVLKDLQVRWPLLNPVFTFLLLFALSCVSWTILDSLRHLCSCIA